MALFTYDGIGITLDAGGAATGVSDAEFRFEISSTSTPFRYVRDPDGGIDITGAIRTMSIDGEVVAAATLDADIRQISWGVDDKRGVANILIVEEGTERFIMQLSGNALPTFATPAEFDTFFATLRSNQPLDFGFYGPDTDIPYIRLFEAGQLGDKAANKLNGDIGNDRLIGEGGKDVLKGKDGDDWLDGGAGADKLYGGAGADTFYFGARGDSGVKAGARDTIFDFSKRDGDKIDLHDMRPAGESFDFRGTKGFTGDAFELRYEKFRGDSVVLVDTNGDRKADFSILVDDVKKLTADDFIL